MENIDSIKNAVEKTKRSYRAIAKEFGTNHTQIGNLIKLHNWNVEHRVSKNSNISTPEAKPHAAILGKTAVRKIEEIKKELGKQYSPVDEPLIVMYAKSYERYIDLESKLGLGVNNIISISSKTGSEYMSPLFTATLAIQKNLVTIANQLGLSIASRKKLGLNFKKEDEGQTSIFDFAKNFAMDDEDLDDI
jgi:P27 family predicted phage terminase small subunit